MSDTIERHAHLSDNERRSNGVFRLNSETTQQRKVKGKLFLGCSYFFAKSEADVLINSALIKRKACKSSTGRPSDVSQASRLCVPIRR